jgi:hypothetical protein
LIRSQRMLVNSLFRRWAQNLIAHLTWIGPTSSLFQRSHYSVTHISERAQGRFMRLCPDCTNTTSATGQPECTVVLQWPRFDMRVVSESRRVRPSRIGGHLKEPQSCSLKAPLSPSESEYLVLRLLPPMRKLETSGCIDIAEGHIAESFMTVLVVVVVDEALVASFSSPHHPQGTRSMSPFIVC